MDAARLMPFLAMIAFFLPIIWTPYLRTGGTGRAAVYLFVVWALLIFLAGILARYLSAPITAAERDADQETGSDGV